MSDNFNHVHTARCLRSSAAVPPTKYELDIIQVTTVLIIRKKWENNGTERIGLVTPTPDLLSIYRVNKRQWYLKQNIFFVLRNHWKCLFLIFRSGLKVLMSIEWFASTRNYWYHTICGFSILYCCLRKNSWLDDISEDNKIKSVSTRRYKLNSHNQF